MAEYENLSGLFADIADAIRDKTGSDELMQAEAFPEAIAGIPTVSGSNQSTVGMISKTITEYIDGANEIEYCASSAFIDCADLREVSFPVCKSVGMWCFYANTSLQTAYFGEVESLDSYCFRNCTSLASLYIMTDFVPELGIYCFSSSPMTSSSYLPGNIHGSIYVRASLVDEFTTAKNWSDVAKRIVGI